MRSLFLFALASGMLSLHAGVIAGSTFDAGTEGWTAVAADPGSTGYNVVSTSPTVFQPAGGNPAYSGDADHSFRFHADHPFRADVDHIGAKRRWLVS